MRRIFTFLLLGILTWGNFLNVKAQVNIPDPNFKAALVGNSNINTNLDGEIQVSEATAFNDSIQVSGLSITDLTGIEAFVNIVYLSASNNSIAGTVDLSANVSLKQIWLSNNPMDSILLPSSNQLQMLVMQSTYVSDLNISNNPGLTTLWCQYTPLFNLNAGNNPVLGNVDCRNGNLTSLDLSSSNNLQILHAENNLLTSLVLPTSNDLYELYVDYNQLTTLDCSVNSNVNKILCSHNNLTSLILPTSSTFMYQLNCSYNNLTCVDMHTLTNLTFINCSNNNLQSVNVKNTVNSFISNNNINLLNNPSLGCVQVDDSTYSASTWANIDTGAFFSTNCGVPVADFISDADSCFGAPVQFTDLSTNATNWQWNFSNIDTLYTQNPVYTFPASGYFTIELTVSNCFGSDSYLDFLAVGKNISGSINSTLGSLTLGDVYLFSYQPIFIAFDTVATAVFQPGSYDLGPVAQGDYILKMVADSTMYPSLIPTYFGDKWSWDSATVIHHTCTADYIADVNILDEVTLTPGSGILAGTIIEGAGFGRAQGDPVHGVDVKLGVTATSQIVGCTETDTNGDYQFTNLPFNSYTIYVDIPGLERDSTYQVILDTASTQYLNLDYVVDSSSVYILPGAGIEQQEGVLKLILAPNPAQGGFYISGYELVEKAQLNIYDITGKLMLTRVITATNEFIDTPLPAGTYFIELRVNGQVYRQKLIKQ